MKRHSLAVSDLSIRQTIHDTGNEPSNARATISGENEDSMNRNAVFAVLVLVALTVVLSAAQTSNDATATFRKLQALEKKKGSQAFGSPVWD